MLQFLGKDAERKHRVLPQHVLDKCVVYLLKISLSNPDTYLKVKNRHFGFLTEEQLKKLLHQDKATLHLQILEVLRRKVVVWLLLLRKKSQRKVHCIYCG